MVMYFTKNNRFAMQQAFELTVKDAEGCSFVLDGWKTHHTEYGVTDVIIGDLSVSVVKDSKEASVDDLGYRKTGNPDDRDTHRRFQGALKWLMEAYPEIERVSVCDVAVCLASGAYLTRERILAGQPGWYEEHYGATVGLRGHFSISGTRRCLAKKKKNLENMAYFERQLFHTIWEISRETIEAYPVRVEGYIEKESSRQKSREEAYLSHRLKSIQAKYGQE